MRLKKIFFRIILIFFSFTLLFSGCIRKKESKTITIKGSDTMVILGQRWAENYMKKNKEVIVQVTGGGTGTGIAALISNSTDICQASRPIEEKEKEIAEKRNNKKLIETKVALDGISIYVNIKNPISSIDFSQLKGIYTGKITNWKSLGWEDKKIIVYSRENNSGTYVFFKEHVLENEDFREDAQTLPGTAAVINAVAKDKYGIGYGGIAYAKGVKTLKVRKKRGEKFYFPNFENIKNNLYPISRYLLFYYYENPREEVKKFIEFVLSEEGQKICKEVGYFPIK
jgi:phosphate transport system substrate-binding protein